MVTLIKENTWIRKVVCSSGSINLLIMIIVYFKDPGVRPKTYRYYSKLKQEPGSADPDITSDSDRGNSPNLNQKEEKLRKLRAAQEHKLSRDGDYEPESTLRCSGKYEYCFKCNISIDVEAMLHCPECDVCIMDYDHHCIFFSKCVGKGNIIMFRAVWGIYFITVILVIIVLSIEQISLL